VGPLASSAEVVKIMAPRIAELVHEEMWLLALDGRNHLRSVRRVAQGGLHSTAVSPRDILRLALSDAASSMVLVHNHPSGDPEPSPEDILMTHRLEAAGDAVGVPLVDHVVISNAGSYASMLDLGVLGRRQ
jgi:DNA repair protein RadC